MELIKAYKPETNSVCSGQVLKCPYDFEKAKLVVREMTDLMVLDLVDKGLATDHYGRKVPKHAHEEVEFQNVSGGLM